MQTKLSCLLVASVSLAVAATNTVAAPAIGIDVGNGVWTDPGEDNPNGLQITATSLGTIGTGGGEKRVTVAGMTFTFNPGAAETVGSWADYSCILGPAGGRYSDAVPWKLEGLVPGGLYHLAFLSVAGQPGKFTVNGAGTAASDADGDGNFENVPAFGGIISGNWDIWQDGQWSTFTALLVEYTEVVVADTNAPGISALSPTNGATGVVPASDLVVTFNEPVTKGSGNIVIKETDGATFATVDVSSAGVTVAGAAVTINPPSDLAAFAEYYVEIDKGAVTDIAANDFDGISGSAVWRFTTGKVPTVVSIDFDANNVVQSGEPTHAEGLTLPGQLGDWYKLSTAGSPGSATIATPAGTFTFNTGGVEYRTYNTASKVLREDFFWLTEGYGPIHWELTGLDPRGFYDIICYGRYVPDYGGYRGADMSIVGHHDGNPVPQETANPPEGDWNFTNVMADATGRIEGVFAWNGNAHAEFAAIQFDRAAAPPSAGWMIIVR